MKSDAELILDHARSQIQGRIDYFKNETQHPFPHAILANLEWSLAQLDNSPGMIRALRERQENDK